MNLACGSVGYKMMPHKTWEISSLAVVLLLYFWMAWHAIAAAARSGWKWYYCLGAGALIVFIGTGIFLFLRHTRTIR